MPKQKITVSLDSEIAKKLRIDSISKYGDARSLSRLIEDLVRMEAEKESTPKEAIRIDPIDPYTLRSYIHLAIDSLDKGKPVPVQNVLGYSMLKGADIEKLLGIELEVKRIMVNEAPCFISEHREALISKSAEITNGLCDGSLHSKLWCPDCEGYYRFAGSDGKYIYMDDIPKGAKIINDEKQGVAPSCDINYGKQHRLTK